MKIGFIGTGVMGKGMIRNLLKHGYEVNIYNRTKAKAEVLVKDGAILKENIEDGIEYDPEKEKKYLAEDVVVADGDLDDGYTEESTEDDILLEDEESLDDGNDELFEGLDDEDDEMFFDSDLANDNLDNDNDII